jgi:hypothetical protein
LVGFFPNKITKSLLILGVVEQTTQPTWVKIRLKSRN